MLTPQQLATIERLQVGLSRVADAVERLNELGRDVGMPPLAIRCSGSKMLSGHIAAENFLLDLIAAHDIERIQLTAEPERLAA